MDAIVDRLFALQDEKYRDFQARLMPTVPYERVIGVRTPALRSLAKELVGTPQAEAFMRELPHRYYEENNLHAFLIESIRPFDACVRALDAFLPYVDNWATCDCMNPKVLGKHKQELYPHILRWLADGRLYTVRFAIGLLMRYYLDADFSPEQLALVAAIDSEEYYLKMMVAWYFATALAKQYGAALPYLLERRLPPWTHKKTICKAIESYRITDEKKAYLRTLA